MPDSPYPPKSTSVRFAAVRGILAGLTRVSPATAASLATVLFRTPPGRRRSDLNSSLFDSGRRVDLTLDGRRLAVWRWGEGPPVLLAHGWGSRGARLGDFVEPVTRAGFSVLAFDAPGHGASGGRLSSLPQFIAAIRAIGERFGPLHAVVAHSMGGAATTLAMARGLAVKRAVFLAPSSDPASYSERFASVLGLSADVISRMKRGLERRFGFLWKDFDVLAAAKTLSAPLLVIHDREDFDVPWSDGESIVAAWPGARLVTTNGLGHRRIVHDPAVVERAVAFVAEAETATRLSGRA
ncbi:MAG TPA: alpha/beta fold hydrolase [Thermoanaerobaculia bacterium]